MAFRVGQRVEVYFSVCDNWCPAKIVQVLPLFNIPKQKPETKYIASYPNIADGEGRICIGRHDIRKPTETTEKLAGLTKR